MKTPPHLTKSTNKQILVLEKLNIFPSSPPHQGFGYMSCAVCGLSDVKLQRCAGCKSRLFCSRSCQQKDWAVHKKNCKPSSVPQKASSALVVPSWDAPKSVLRIPFSRLSPALFAAQFSSVSCPVVVTDLFEEHQKVLHAFADSAKLARGLAECPLQCRVYGAGHMSKQVVFVD